jgi:hypothetical protein
VAEQTVPPETRYALVGRDRLAYQILGQGPPGHVDMVWEACAEELEAVMDAVGSRQAALLVSR